MPRVLIVDDNDSIRRLVRKILERVNYEAQDAHDGVEAIEILGRESFDAIVLDLMMPRANGFAVMKFLADEQPEALRITVVLTADSTRWDDPNLRGVASVLRKPFAIDDLLTAVRACCGSAESS
ncbi:MAG: response regulator [Acidobacteriota bacterium]